MLSIGVFRPYAVRLLQAAAAAASRNPNTAASAQRPAAAHAAPSTAFALDRPRPVHLALSSLPASDRRLSCVGIARVLPATGDVDPARLVGDRASLERCAT